VQTHRLTLLLFVLTLLLPASAHAGRKVRLMYDAPSASSGGPAVAVTFENAREAKKGGDELPLIAQERGSYGIPSGIFSGARKSGHADTVVPEWATSVLRAAGYDARVGADPSLPTLNVRLAKLWGDGMGPRQTFSFQATLSLHPPGGGDATWEGAIIVSTGVTTIIRFDDKFELGFVRAFDDGTKSLLASIATEGFQAALPGANLEAAAAAAAVVGTEEAGLRKDDTAVASDGGDEGDEATAPKENDTPCKSFDPDVARWGCTSLISGFVMAGVGVGLTIGGDQISRQLATDLGHPGLPVVGSTFTSGLHFPASDPAPEVGPAVLAHVSELMFVYGLQTTVPVLAANIPGAIVGGSGADIQTMKAFAGIVTLPAMAPAAVVHLHRFATVWVPEWERNAEGGP